MNFDEIYSWYQKVNWESLKKSEFGEAGDLSPVADSLDRIKKSFDFLIRSTKKRLVPQSLEDSISSSLINFKKLVNEINGYTDAARRNEMCDKVRRFEYKLQQDFAHVFSYFLVQTEMNDDRANPGTSLNERQIINLIQKHQKQAGLETQDVINLINQTVPSESLNKAKSLVNDLLKEKDNINSAIDISKKVIESNEQLVKSILEVNAEDAANKSLEHKTFYVEYKENYLFTKIPVIREILTGVFYLFPYFKWVTKIPVPYGAYVWLLASLLSGAGVIGIVFFFINSGEDVSVGNAILRISAIIVPSYFAVLFSRQFLNHKKLYEFYMFKKVASQTMITLRSQFQKGSTADEKVLEKGLDVLFNEPNLNDKDNKFDSALIKDLVEILSRR